MRRRAPSQAWTLSRVHRVLRPLRTKVAALATSLKKEKLSSVPPNAAAPTPTPTRLRPPLRRTYQARRKRKRGSGSDDDGQYLPHRAPASKSKPKHNGKPERKWSLEVLERISAVVDAFRVLADVVYDEQVEVEGGGGNILKLRDMCVRALATDIEPSAVAAAGPTEDDSDDEGGLVDVTIIVDQKFEEIPEHLRRAAIIPYALSMIKQHIDTISPLPQLWNHLLAICISSSASPSPANTADVLQICTNLFSASLHQPRSGSRGLASVYRNIVGSGPDRISSEVFCQTFLAIFTRQEQDLEDNYGLPPNFGGFPQPGLYIFSARSPTQTPARRRGIVPPTPPTYDPSADSDDPTGALFPMRSLLSRSVAHLVAELGPSALLSFVEAAAEALMGWLQTDHYAALFRERENTFQRKASDVRSLAPRLCARITDWVAMVLADVWSRPISLADLARAASALGKVVELVSGAEIEGKDQSKRYGPTNQQEGVDRRSNKTTWLDVGDPFCALTCVYFAKLPKGSALDNNDSKLATILYQLPLTARNCHTLLGTLSGLQRDETDVETTPKPMTSHFNFPEPVSPSAALMSLDPAPPPTFVHALRIYTRALSSANCPHLEATLLQLIVNERPYVDGDIEVMLEDAETRWEQLDPRDPMQVEEDGWEWARSRWKWDEITNTWVERNKSSPFAEYMHVPRKAQPTKKKTSKPREIIAVSSDTEEGLQQNDRSSSQDQDQNQDETDGSDSDDVFAAIPTPKYTSRHLRSPIQTRRRSINRVQTRVAYVSSDDDEYQGSASRPKTARRNAVRSARPSFNWNENESENESETEIDSETETGETSTSGSEADESDFDWTQYNSRYHPHDRLSGPSSSSSAMNTRRLSNRLSTRSAKKNDSDQENRTSVQVSRPVRVPNRVVSDPVPAAKRQRVVVELPILSKRPKHRPLSTAVSNKPPVLGNHNASRREAPAIREFESPPRRPARSAREITTSTLERLCLQFTNLSSDDDRDTVIDVVDDSEEERLTEMPSSDDMNLFQVVTPAPRRTRDRPGAAFWC